MGQLLEKRYCGADMLQLQVDMIMHMIQELNDILLVQIQLCEHKSSKFDWTAIGTSVYMTVVRSYEYL